MRFYVRFLFAFILCALVFSEKVSAQKVDLKLIRGERPILETNYQYVQVLDHRVQKSKIGEVFERAGQKIPVAMQADLEAAATTFFSQGVNPGDSAEKKIQVRIYELELQEKRNPDKELYEGEVVLGIGFFVIGSFDPVHLLDYSGSIQYQRSGFRMDKVEEVVNRLFQNSLVYFDNWIINQNLSNRALAKTFRLDIVEGNRESTEEKVYYVPDRPLVWGDFRARPRPTSRNNATIFTSFSLEGVSLMDSGSMVQTLEINVYMLPGQSWVRTPSAYALNHEQRHFDIVRIVADRLIYKLKNKELSLDFYQAEINEAYLDSYREMNRLQELYEKGTNHGIDQVGQALWNGLIDDALEGQWEWIENALTPSAK